MQNEIVVYSANKTLLSLTYPQIGVTTLKIYVIDAFPLKKSPMKTC